MNRTQKFVLNSSMSMLSQIIIMISGLITPRLMISTYGSEVNGLVSSLNQFISYIALVEAGIGGAAIYSLYKPISENNHGRISSIVVAARNSYRQAGYIFSSGLFILAVVYAMLRQSETLSFGTILSLTIILGINGCVDFFFLSGHRALLTADQRNYVITFIGNINTILRTVIICLLAFYKVNVVLLYLCTASLAFIKIAYIYSYSKKRYPYINNNAAPDKSAMNKRWDVIYQQILGMIQMGAPTVLATIFIDLITVSVYSVYNMVVSGINGILNVFISGLPAGFGDLIARNERETLKNTVSEFEVAYYYILSITYGLAFVLIMPFIRVYTNGLTDANYYYPALGFLIVLNGLLYNINTPQSMLIISAGMYKETRWRVTAQGLIIIVLGIILVKFNGIVGVLIASCASNLYRTIDLLFFTLKHITGNSVSRTAFRMFIVFANVFVIMLPMLFFNIVTSNFFEWLIYACIFAIYAIAVSTITALLFDKKYFLAVFNRLFKTFFGRRK